VIAVRVCDMHGINMYMSSNCRTYVVLLAPDNLAQAGIVTRQWAIVLVLFGCVHCNKLHCLSPPPFLPLV
jgi:hypothetical protein